METTNIILLLILLWLIASSSVVLDALTLLFVWAMWTINIAIKGIKNLCRSVVRIYKHIRGAW